MRSVGIPNKNSKAILVAIIAFFIALGMAPFANAGVAEAKAYKGTYEYTSGHPELWGIGKGPQNGYILQCKVTGVKGNRVTLQIEQTVLYGDAGYYIADSKKKTVTLKSNYATFKFKTFCGDTCKAKLKVVSKNKLKLAIKTTSSGHERIPISTNYKYKVLKRR